jgi:hypothetical protein
MFANQSSGRRERTPRRAKSSAIVGMIRDLARLGPVRGGPPLA